MAVDPSQACRRCTWCRDGRSNLCPEMRYFGSAATDPPTDGTLCELKAVPAANCHRLGDALSYASGALLEPLAVACHAVLRAGRMAGRRVAVSGGGTIGQLVATVARALGAGHVAVADPRPAARAAAAAARGRSARSGRRQRTAGGWTGAGYLRSRRGVRLVALGAGAHRAWRHRGPDRHPPAPVQRTV